MQRDLPLRSRHSMPSDITFHNDEALQTLLARVTEQARLKKLDR